MFLYIVAPKPPCIDQNCTRSFGKYPNIYRNGSIEAKISIGKCTFTRHYRKFSNISCVSCSHGSYADGISCKSKYFTKIRRNVWKAIILKYVFQKNQLQSTYIRKKKLIKNKRRWSSHFVCILLDPMYVYPLN